MGELKAADFVLIALGIWLALLSIFLLQTIAHYRRLTRGQNIADLGKILERIVSKQDLQDRQLSEIGKALTNQQNIALKHFTKHALIRFNPFEDSGGDQSFVIALLDSKNNGIVLSSLHSRSGTRVYAKEVIEAKSHTHKFSKEEKEAVEKAALKT